MELELRVDLDEIAPNLISEVGRDGFAKMAGELLSAFEEIAAEDHAGLSLKVSRTEVEQPFNKAKSVGMPVLVSSIFLLLSARSFDTAAISALFSKILRIIGKVFSRKGKGKVSVKVKTSDGTTLEVLAEDADDARSLLKASAAVQRVLKLAETHQRRPSRKVKRSGT